MDYRGVYMTIALSLLHKKPRDQSIPAYVAHLRNIFVRPRPDQREVVWKEKALHLEEVVRDLKRKLESGDAAKSSTEPISRPRTPPPSRKRRKRRVSNDENAAIAHIMSIADDLRGIAGDHLVIDPGIRAVSSYHSFLALEDALPSLSAKQTAVNISRRALLTAAIELTQASGIVLSILPTLSAERTRLTTCCVDIKTTLNAVQTLVHQMLTTVISSVRKPPVVSKAKKEEPQKRKTQRKLKADPPFFLKLEELFLHLTEDLVLPVLHSFTLLSGSPQIPVLVETPICSEPTSTALNPSRDEAQSCPVSEPINKASPFDIDAALYLFLRDLFDLLESFVSSSPDPNDGCRPNHQDICKIKVSAISYAIQQLLRLYHSGDVLESYKLHNTSQSSVATLVEPGDQAKDLHSDTSQTQCTEQNSDDISQIAHATEVSSAERLETAWTEDRVNSRKKTMCLLYQTLDFILSTFACPEASEDPVREATGADDGTQSDHGKADGAVAQNSIPGRAPDDTVLLSIADSLCELLARNRPHLSVRCWVELEGEDRARKRMDEDEENMILGIVEKALSLVQNTIAP